MTARVLRVVDGDTMRVSLRVRARNDAPELSTPAGRAAARALAEEFPVGTEVELVPIYSDVYGRLVATIRKKGGGT